MRTLLSLILSAGLCAAGELTTSVVDAGGQRAAAGAVAHDGSLVRVAALDDLVAVLVRELAVFDVLLGVVPRAARGVLVLDACLVHTVYELVYLASLSQVFW